ncbi:hybrid sensor histidine kinase/response regulator [Dysgonomonas sp. 216]|uniref:hybrid sensor histidine kinase/response regulator transcription factor n=1 Tax=Dysgonomonas sp. 216 TaxID=2302934 RepID=UPI0013D2DAAE|nr:hybrid sensor histidine kinase/response regulator transcription factor [Dysgonomonas sp. 216]NDW17748.1 hybrid sensor histidine kinase/response regulator [Dysgonomonas sp. 216]
MKTTIVIVLNLLFIFSVKSQDQYIFRHLDIVDGLSDNQIRNLSQLPDGRIGIKTASILNIYNGATFDYYYQNKRMEHAWDYSRPPKEYYDKQGRIWMKEQGYLLLLDLNSNQFNYNIEDELKSFGIDKKLTNLFLDESKNYWFVTNDSTFSFYDINKKELIVITEGDSDFTRKHGVPIELTQYKNLCWIVYSNGLIRCWDYTSQEFVLQDTRFFNKIGLVTDRLYIHPSSTGDIWLMYNYGVHLYNRTEKTWTDIASISGLSNFFTCMDIDLDGNAWVGTSRSGLRHINSKTLDVTTISGMKLDKGGTLVNDIYSIFVDNNNGVWVGTLFQGLCYYQPSMHKFQLIQTVHSETAITNETIRCFLEDEDGTILVGAGNGLYRFYPETKIVEKIYADKINDLCLSLYRDSKNRIWVGTFLNGFYCIDNKNIKHFIRSSTNLDLDPNQNVSRAIYEDNNGHFWGSVPGGVASIDPNTGKIIYILADKHPKIKNHTTVYNFYPVDNETFAVVGESGIFYYNPQKDEVWVPDVDTPDSPKFQDFNIKYYCIYKDSRGFEWYGTEAGIRLWDNTNNRLYKITSNDGLPNNAVSAIIEDNNGIMWVSTANGICKINIQTNYNEHTFSIVSFGTSDGLQSGKFYDRSSLKAKDGKLYFGGIHGFNYFDPQKIDYNKSINRPIFTGLSLFNSPIKKDSIYNGHVILKKPINLTNEIKLHHNENFISIEFSGLNYVNPAQTYYRYKLHNFDENWNEVLTNGLGKVTYTGLPSGKYKFVVYTANNDKVWGDEPSELTIIIKPPFWATAYAIAIYIVIIMFVLYYLYQLQDKRTKRKISEQKEVNMRKQKEELDQMKFKFFTNISHEFRTPLTLITTPLDILIKQQDDETLKKRLESIYKNAANLLQLVNQLLDFRKLEMKGEKNYLQKSDIVQFIESIYIQFKDTTASRNIDFALETDIDSTIMFFDQDKMHKIMNNLLSNALKFTPEGGHISLKISKVKEGRRNFINIIVSDTGCGMAPKDMEQIFDRFYQGKKQNNMQPGSGIGLHLVKEYVKLHEGSISVESDIGIGSEFSVLIPTDLMGTEEKEVNENGIQAESTDKKISTKTLLIVEDNNEFRNFLIEQLSPIFKILEAEDGVNGEQIAINELPDLIVSDLMMPRVDGLELCRRLKLNIQTSHIPFILLTARSSDEAKIDGYEAGADSYISKPFNFDMLLTRINKLIEQQEKRKELFHKTIEVTPSSITTTSLDEELVQRALMLVEKNMDNTGYSIDNLSKDIGLSRSQLYRKLQSITGLTPIEFIRSIRLKRAAQLLINSQYNISEIADIVGFNTLKYFNKYFKEEFGMPPTQYRLKNK